MTDKDALIRHIIRLTSDIPPEVLRGFCDELECQGSSRSSDDFSKLARSFGPPSVREAFLQLMNNWQPIADDMTLGELAWALRGASAQDESHRKRQSLELVWTGPVLGSSTLRRTDQALLDLIQSSEESLIIVTFVAYRIPRVADAMAKAAKRGVSIILILESAEQSEGKVAFDALKALGNEVASKADIFVWPLDQRKLDESGNHGSLHAKCAIADRSMLFISSANLTEYALDLNIEMGLFIHGGDLPLQADRHFRSLISHGVLRKLRLS